MKITAVETKLVRVRTTPIETTLNSRQLIIMIQRGKHDRDRVINIQRTRFPW